MCRALIIEVQCVYIVKSLCDGVVKEDSIYMVTIGQGVDSLSREQRREGVAVKAGYSAYNVGRPFIVASSLLFSCVKYRCIHQKFTWCRRVQKLGTSVLQWNLVCLGSVGPKGAHSFQNYTKSSNFYSLVGSLFYTLVPCAMCFTKFVYITKPST